jgi:hypothetical protein
MYVQATYAMTSICHENDDFGQKVLNLCALTASSATKQEYPV